MSPNPILNPTDCGTGKLLMPNGLTSHAEHAPVEGQKLKILASLDALEGWVEKNSYRGYEPFDGLSSYLRALTFKNLFLERVLQQAVRRVPFNLRPLIGVTKKESTKGRGYMAAGYLAMYRATESPAYLTKANSCLCWLDENRARQYESHSWGNHFDFSSRSGRLPAHEPIIVWTSLIGHAFLDGYEVAKDEHFLQTVRSVCSWIMSLPREKTHRGSCLSYVAYSQQSVHNSNMLGAGILARAARLLDSQEMRLTAKEAMEYSCSRQRSDGSWFYGESPQYRWIDNFHTAYNLDSLKCYVDHTGDHDYDENLMKGFEFYIDHFFTKRAAPKYYHDKIYPIDSQCVSQSIETLAKFGVGDERAMNLCLAVADWAIDNMQDRKRGNFYFRRYPFGIIDRTPMLHWAQATMYKALSLLYLALGEGRAACP